MWSEFRAFLVKSNALALALAFILGLALATVVNSLVKDIIMPPVGLALGKVDFQNLFIDLSGKGYPSLKAAQDAAMIKTVPTKVCPRCAADDLPMAATRCPHCTSDIARAAA
ncbi:MAG: large conductance mechanosensitive channel protein MscL [Chloroflexi bacterium]|nr:MAG: large conductance mechanosensitive channel protein MscL [Chloroflexota bacterium]